MVNNSENPVIISFISSYRELELRSRMKVVDLGKDDRQGHTQVQICGCGHTHQMVVCLRFQVYLKKFNENYESTLNILYENRPFISKTKLRIKPRYCLPCRRLVATVNITWTRACHALVNHVSHSTCKQGTICQWTCIISL